MWGNSRPAPLLSRNFLPAGGPGGPADITAYHRAGGGTRGSSDGPCGMGLAGGIGFAWAKK